jgi:hypothetical protein
MADGEPTGRPPASLSIANTLTVWRVALGGRVFVEDRPLTADGGEVRVRASSVSLRIGAIPYTHLAVQLHASHAGTGLPNLAATWNG